MDKNMKTVVVLMTCFNRCEKTEQCIESLSKASSTHFLKYVIVNDGSTDGTGEMLSLLARRKNIHVVDGNGELYYTGGMRKGMEYILFSYWEYDYLLMVNDDVIFLNNCIDVMINKSSEMNGAVIVGATFNEKGILNYGAIKFKRKNSLKYRILDITEQQVEADTFNGNCVLIPKNIFKKIGTMDAFYTHNWGEFDYGMMIVRSGYKIYTSCEYVGRCDDNVESYLDKNKTIYQRLKEKESPKGAPFKQWFYYLHKNYGLLMAVLRCWTPYVRLILGK